MKTYRNALQKEFERHRETAEEEELALLCDSQTPLLPDVD
jgi:hypothetical protein